MTTLNNILTDTKILTNAEKHALRTILQELLNYNLCPSVYHQIADIVYHTMRLGSTLCDRFTDILYSHVIMEAKKYA